MKKIFTFFLCAIVCCTVSFGQSLTSFSCSSTNPTYVIGFKNGTNCTPAPFNVYTTSLSGTLSAQPLFSTPDTMELNGIGINSVDNKGYALYFRRIASGSGCTNDTVKLIRFGANGATQTLGYIPQPAGTIINTALGTLNINGDYYFGAIVGGQFSVGIIAGSQSLAGGTGPLTVTYRTVTLACNDRNFSDWAFNPATPNVLYTYGIGVSATAPPQVTGTVMTLDLNVPGNPVLTCLSSTTTSGNFSDPADDNFGGIMFGNDGMMYGVNVNTRRYYRINPSTGAIAAISTITADGAGNTTGSQLRGDMGSCAITSTPPSSFNCPGSYVISYKNGTNCSKFPHNLYNIDFATGNMNPTPFLSTPDTIEINAIGLSKKDGKGYGFIYRRDDNTTPGSCINDTIKFFRFGANGVTEILGYIRQTTVSPIIIPNTAVGAMDANGNFYFVSFANVFPYVCKISATDTLTAQPNRQIPFTYQQISGCVRVFADWAISPTTGQLVSYGIYRRPLAAPNNKVVGNIITIDPVTGFSSCIGTETENEFTDEGNDNMGGIMFGADGFLYGANSYTRKYYKINVSTGVIANINSIANLNNPNPSTPQIRVDMASCISDATTLPIGFNDFTVVSGGDCKANITWEASGTEDGDAFTLERSADGIKYTTVGSVRGSASVSKYALADTKPGLTNYYRIKGVSRDGSIKYSSVVRYLSSCGSKNNALLFNTMVTNSTLTGEVSLYRTQTVAYTIYNAAGVQVFSKSAVNNAGNSRFSFNVPNLAKGVYMMQILISGEKFMQKFVVQ